MNTFEKDNAFVAPTYARFPLEITGGKGAVLRGNNQKEYIDMGSGIAVNTFGGTARYVCPHIKSSLYLPLCNPCTNALRKNGNEKRIFLQFGSGGK